jgi:transcriptional regulator with PAS, ATPase and Fis domain
MKRLREKIQKVAPTTSKVLITGGNGTGKEVVAKEIHSLSERKSGPFIQVNCAAIPEELIEVELFGNVEGYLTYSPDKRIGKFEQANNGTIFLDEIADLSLEAQAKLINVLTVNAVEPLGSNEVIPIDVRVIASTNRNLNELITENKFREDLYHRINVAIMFPLKMKEGRHTSFIEYF